VKIAKDGKFGWSLSILYMIIRSCTDIWHLFPFMISSALKVMRDMRDKCSWNYQNKVHLLEAELFSATDKKDKARASFNAAISTARSSKFVHEQGLACELAAFHYMKCEDYDNASNLFRQARECYAQWGSEVKVDKMTSQLETITAAKSNFLDG